MGIFSEEIDKFLSRQRNLQGEENDLIRRIEHCVRTEILPGLIPQLPPSHDYSQFKVMIDRDRIKVFFPIDSADTQKNPYKDSNRSLQSRYETLSQKYGFELQGFIGYSTYRGVRIINF